MFAQRSETSYIVHDIVPILSRLGYPGAGDRDRLKINDVPIYRPSGGRSGSTIDMIYYHNGEPLLLVEAKSKHKSHEDALKEAENYHLNFPKEAKEFASSNKAPNFIATTVGSDIKFYKIRYKIEKNSPKAISEEIDMLSWEELLENYGLKPKYKPKVLDVESFRRDFLNHLAAIYLLPPNKKITPGIVRNVAEQILSYLENETNYQSRHPYTLLEREIGRQSEVRDLFYLYDLKGSLGPELAAEFRKFILRSFQGREFNQFMTEQCVIDFMCELVGPLKSKILDFECGSGGFLAAALNYWQLRMSTMLGIDIDELPFILSKTYLAIYFKITGARINDIPIKHDNGLFYWGNDWDLILSNPAGGSSYPPKAKKGQKQKEIDRKYNLKEVLNNLESDLDKNNKIDKISEYYLSVQQAVRSCQTGGKICMILPEGFFSNSSDEILRKYVAKHCKVLAIISLPRGAFKRGTSVKSATKGKTTALMKMSILYAQKIAAVVDGEGIDLDGVNLSYPVFLVNIEVPESLAGDIEKWLKPRLSLVLEQWKTWEKKGELTALSEKAEISSIHVREAIKVKQVTKAKPKKPKQKFSHNVDEHLRSLFKKK